MDNGFQDLDGVSVDLDNSFLLLQRCSFFIVRSYLFGFSPFSFAQWKQNAVRFSVVMFSVKVHRETQRLITSRALKTNRPSWWPGRFFAQKNVLYRWKEFLSTIRFFSGFGQWTEDGLGFRIIGCWSFSMDLDRLSGFG